MALFSFPILKAEKLADGRLLVEGIATSETPDAQNDVMDFAGSKAAFSKWRGNLREAHDPKKMVGKALDWWPVEDAKQIGVRAFISAGAPDTQKKVEDGTLSMFSVGGDSKRTSMEKMGDKRIRRVLEWDMTELSLVDSGANPDAAFTIAKGDVASEELAEEQDIEKKGTALEDAGSPAPTADDQIEKEIVRDEAGRFASDGGGGGGESTSNGGDRETVDGHPVIKLGESLSREEYERHGSKMPIHEKGKFQTLRSVPQRGETVRRVVAGAAASRNAFVDGKVTQLHPDEHEVLGAAKQKGYIITRNKRTGEQHSAHVRSYAKSAVVGDIGKENTMPEDEVAKAADTGEDVEKPFDHFAAVKHHEAEAEKATDPEAKKLHLAAAKAHEKAADDPEFRSAAEEASKAAHDFKKGNRFAEALLSALEKRKEPVVEKCSKSKAMTHLEEARNVIEKGWLEDKIAEREAEEKAAVSGDLRKNYGEFMPVLSVPKMPEDDISFAIMVLGTLRQACQWIDTLTAAEAHEAPPEPEDIATLGKAKAGVDAAIVALAEFVGMEASEIAEGKEATVVPALLKRANARASVDLSALAQSVLDSRRETGEAVTKAITEITTSVSAASDAALAKAVADIRTTIETPAPEPESRLTKSDVSALADALGVVLGEEREKTSKVVGALLEKVESVGMAVADLLQKTVTVGEGVERILKAPVPGGPARFDVRKMATASEGAINGDEEYAALLHKYDEAPQAQRAFYESQLLIARAARAMREQR